MCGIVGLIAKSNNAGFWKHHEDLFENMLRMDSIRGMDSTGVFGIKKDGVVEFLKGNANGYVFTTTENYARFAKKIYTDYISVVGHNRKATKGSVTPQNAHPFKYEHITLVHNGTIHNHKDLNKDVEVDSEAIASSLAKHDAAGALKLIHGAFALVWYDDKDGTLNLARNDQRTLYLVEYDTSWVISSEIGLPLWLQGRENKKSIKYELVPTDKIISFNMKDLAEPPKETPYEEYKAPIVVFQHHPRSGHEHFPERFNRGNQHYRQPQYNTNSGLPVVKTTQPNELLKQGATIKFKVETYEEAIPPHYKSEILIGHPLFGNDMDMNLWVRAVCSPGKKIADYLAEGDVFTGIIMNVRDLAGKLIIYAQNPQCASTIKDIHGEENLLSEVSNVLQWGCSKCKGPMVMKDVPNSVVQKKKDGSFRTRCHGCLSDALSSAGMNHPLEGMNPTPNVH